MDDAQRYDIDHNYKLGFDSGVCWNASWVPGGPFVCDKKGKILNEAWLRGWRDGIAAQKAATPE